MNQESAILAIRPCQENERDAFSWCTTGSGRRNARQITCRLFFAKVFDLMGWNPDHRYKLLGKVIHANGEYLIAFDLAATEVYQRVMKDGQTKNFPYSGFSGRVAEPVLACRLKNIKNPCRWISLKAMPCMELRKTRFSPIDEATGKAPTLSRFQEQHDMIGGALD